MASLDEIETRRNGNDSARIEELIDVFKWPDGKWVQVRLMDRGLLPIYALGSDHRVQDRQRVEDSPALLEH